MNSRTKQFHKMGQNGLFWRRITATFVIIVFTLFDAARYAPQGYASSSAVTVDPGTALFSIPKELGKIDEVYFPADNGGRMTEGAKAVIFIQDAHDSLEAQENIAKIINLLVKEKGIKTVFEEGYEGPVPTDKFFGFIKDPAIKQKVSYFLLDKLRIGGAEYAHINRTGAFDLMGVEDLKLYRENIRHYQNASKNKKETEEDLALLFARITTLADQYFPRDLKTLLKKQERFHAGQLPLLDYLKELRSLYLKNKVGKAANRFSGEYPVLSVILMAQASEDRTLLGQVNRLDSSVIFKEMGKLETAISADLLKNGRDRKVFGYYQGLNLLQRLNRIELTPAEYEAAKEILRDLRTQDLAEFVASQTHKSLVLSKEWEQNIKDPVRFYEAAHSRDSSVEARLEDFSKSSKEGAAVLVFGGFHANRIKEILREKGFSYAVISPRFNPDDKRHQAYYKQLMSVGHYSFEVPAHVTQAARPESEFVVATAVGENVVHQRLAAMASWAGDLRSDLDPATLNQMIEQRLSVFDPVQPRSGQKAVVSNARSETREKLEKQLKQLASDEASGLREEQIPGILEAIEKGVLTLRGEDLDIIKIVNGKEMVIGAIDRNIAHSYGLLHRVPDTFTVTPEGKFLIQRRAHNKSEALRFSLVGGHVKAGRDYRGAIKEEIVEESGLPEGWQIDDRRLKVIRVEGGFGSPVWDVTNRERRSTFIYFATEEEVLKIREMKQFLGRQLQELGDAGFKEWLEVQQKEENGYGEVWSIHELTYDELMKLNPNELSSDLLAPLLHDPANQDVLDALRSAALGSGSTRSEVRGEDPKKLYEERMKVRDLDRPGILEEYTQQKDGKLADHPKFHSGLKTKTFEGFTTLAHVRHGTPLHEKLVELQAGIERKLKEAGHEGEFAFLEPSFHMTFVDIDAGAGWSKTGVDRRKEQLQKAFEEIGAPGPVTAQVRGVGMGSSIAALVWFDQEEDLRKVLGFEEKIKNATGVKKRPMAGHISLAYIVKYPPKGNEGMREIVEVLKEFQNEDLGEFRVEDLDLAYFSDMDHIVPLLSKNLTAGSVTTLDKNIWNVQDRQNAVRRTFEILPGEEFDLHLVALTEPSGKFEDDHEGKRGLMHARDGEITVLPSYEEKNSAIPSPLKTPWGKLVEDAGLNSQGATLISYQDLFHNDWFVAFQGETGMLLHGYGEPFEQRTYSMFVRWNDGTVTSEDLRFVQKQGEEPGRVEVYRDNDKENADPLASKIQFAVFGQRLIHKFAIVPAENFAAQFSDVFQLYRYPEYKSKEDEGGTKFGDPFVKIFRGEEKHPMLPQDRKLLWETLKNKGYVELDLAGLLADPKLAGISWEEIQQQAFRRRGYTEVPEKSKEELAEGEYYVKGKTLYIRLRPFPYPHDLIGITQSGKAVAIVLPGDKTKDQGYAIPLTKQKKTPQLQQVIIDAMKEKGDPIREAFLLANSKDAFLWRDGQIVPELSSAKTYSSGSAAIVFVKKDKITVRSEMREKPIKGKARDVKGVRNPQWILPSRREKLLENEAKDGKVRIYIGTATLADGWELPEREQKGLALYADILEAKLNEHLVPAVLEHLPLPGDVSPTRHFGSIEYDYYLAVNKEDEGAVRDFISALYKSGVQVHAGVWELQPKYNGTATDVVDGIAEKTIGTDTIPDFKNIRKVGPGRFRVERGSFLVSVETAKEAMERFPKRIDEHPFIVSVKEHLGISDVYMLEEGSWGYTQEGVHSERIETATYLIVPPQFDAEVMRYLRFGKAFLELEKLESPKIRQYKAAYADVQEKYFDVQEQIPHRGAVVIEEGDMKKFAIERPVPDFTPALLVRAALQEFKKGRDPKTAKETMLIADQQCRQSPSAAMVYQVGLGWIEVGDYERAISLARDTLFYEDLLTHLIDVRLKKGEDVSPTKELLNKLRREKNFSMEQREVGVFLGTETVTSEEFNQWERDLSDSYLALQAVGIPARREGHHIYGDIGYWSESHYKTELWATTLKVPAKYEAVVRAYLAQEQGLSADERIALLWALLSENERKKEEEEDAKAQEWVDAVQLLGRDTTDETKRVLYSTKARLPITRTVLEVITKTFLNMEHRVPNYTGWASSERHTSHEVIGSFVEGIVKENRDIVSDAALNDLILGLSHSDPYIQEVSLSILRVFVDGDWDRLMRIRKLLDSAEEKNVKDPGRIALITEVISTETAHNLDTWHVAVAPHVAKELHWFGISAHLESSMVELDFHYHSESHYVMHKERLSLVFPAQKTTSVYLYLISEAWKAPDEFKSKIFQISQRTASGLEDHLEGLGAQDETFLSLCRASSEIHPGFDRKALFELYQKFKENFKNKKLETIEYANGSYTYFLINLHPNIYKYSAVPDILKNDFNIHCHINVMGKGVEASPKNADFVILYLVAGDETMRRVLFPQSSEPILEARLKDIGIQEAPDETFRSIYQAAAKINPGLDLGSLFEIYQMNKTHLSRPEQDTDPKMVTILTASYDERLDDPKDDTRFLGGLQQGTTEVTDDPFLFFLKEKLGISGAYFSYYRSIENWDSTRHFFNGVGKNYWVVPKEYGDLMALYHAAGDIPMRRLLLGEFSEIETVVERGTRQLGKGSYQPDFGNKEAGFLIFEKLGLPYPPGIVLDENLVSILADLPPKEAEKYLPFIEKQLNRAGIKTRFYERWKMPYDEKEKGVIVRSNPKRSMPGILTSIRTSYDLMGTIQRAARAWKSTKAKAFRKREGIPDTFDLPLIVQEWESGKEFYSRDYQLRLLRKENLPLFAAGVFSTRNPNTSEDVLFGQYREKADGEELMTGGKAGNDINALAQAAPEIYQRLLDAKKKLEGAVGPQEVEFVVNNGKLYFVQTRRINFSPQAEIAYLREQIVSGKITEAKALPRLEKLQEQLRSRKLYKVKENTVPTPLARGLASTPGAFQGHLVWNMNRARQFIDQGEPVVFASDPKNQNDALEAIFETPRSGLITNYGNSSSHEAVLTRLSGIPSLINLQGADWQLWGSDSKIVLPSGEVLREGNQVVIDGDHNALFVSAGDVLEENGTVNDASYGIHIPTYRKEFLTPYLAEDGSIKPGVTVQQLEMLNRTAEAKYLSLKDGSDKKAAFVANLEKHFLHDLLVQRQTIERKNPSRSEVREISGPTGNAQRAAEAKNTPIPGRSALSAAEGQRSEIRADKMVKAIRKGTQTATVFLDAEDFPNLSLSQKNEYFYTALSGRGVRIVVYNERGRAQDKELGALLKLDRVTRTDRDLAGAQIRFDRPGAPSLHLSKKILPSQELVQRLRKKVSFFKTQGQNGGTLAAALLWAWSGGEDTQLREINLGRDGFWIVADSLVKALQRSYNATLAFAVAA